MTRHYAHRVTKRERAAVEILYGPNRRDAFSHSQQCDAYFSGPVVTHPGTGNLVAGFEQTHTGCRCWCHNTEHLFESAEPEYDLTPPPEFATSADLAFAATEPAHVRIAAEAHEVLEAPPAFNEPERQIDPVTSSQFPNRSEQELASGKCDNCGDPLRVCECIE